MIRRYYFMSCAARSGKQMYWVIGNRKSWLPEPFAVYKYLLSECAKIKEVSEHDLVVVSFNRV